MDYKEIWNEICFHVRNRSDDIEDFFQITTEFLFEKLGWSIYKGEIVSKRTVRIGASREGIPDIIIKCNDNDVFVVEVKRVNANITKSNEEQLNSYMRLLRLEFGILFGKSLQIYHDVPSDNESAIKVCEIKFKENSDIGAECIAVLSKSEFSLNRLKAFCEKCFADSDTYIEKTTPKLNQNEKKKSSGAKNDYGPYRSGKWIYEEECKLSGNAMFVGKQRIKDVLETSSRNEIDVDKFKYFHEKSRIDNSWITGEEFKKIYENRPLD